MNLTFLFNNDNYLAINKPPNIPVDGDHKITVENSAPQPHKLVHQLDSPTSGVLLLAKNRKAAAAAAKQFELRKTIKFYLAILEKPVEIKNVNQPICDDLEDFKGFKMKIGGEKQAETFIYNIARNQLGNQLVLLKPITGRRHQLRVHCQFAGSVIQGDKTYGGELEGQRLKLHSVYLKNNALEESLFAEVEDFDEFFTGFNLKINWVALKRILDEWVDGKEADKIEDMLHGCIY